MAGGAVGGPFFRKEFGEKLQRRGWKSQEKRGKWTSAGGFGQLLVQNLSQEVQEPFGSRGKAKNPRKKLEIEGFGV